MRDLKTGKAVPVSSASPVNHTALIAFPSSSGSRYLVYPAGGPDSLPGYPEASKPNSGPKEWKGRRIGIGRQF